MEIKIMKRMNLEQQVVFFQRYLMFRIKNLPQLVAQDVHILKFIKQVVVSLEIYLISLQTNKMNRYLTI